MLIFANTVWLTLLVFWTLFLYQQTSHNNLIHYLYNLGYALFIVPAVFVLVFKILSKSRDRLTYIFLSLSSVCFFLANITWFYFNLYLENAIPYPSVADLLWLAFYVFALISAALIFKTQTPTVSSLFEIIFITAISFLPLHSFMTQNLPATDSISITLLNFLYPLLDSFLVAIYLTILRNSPNTQNTSLPFLFSFLFYTLADALFAYQTGAGTYWNGNLTDLFFALATFLFCLGCIRFTQSVTSVSSPSNKQVTP